MNINNSIKWNQPLGVSEHLAKLLKDSCEGVTFNFIKNELLTRYFSSMSLTIFLSYFLQYIFLKYRNNDFQENKTNVFRRF